LPGSFGEVKWKRRFSPAIAARAATQLEGLLCWQQILRKRCHPTNRGKMVLSSFFYPLPVSASVDPRQFSKDKEAAQNFIISDLGAFI
jgi:hypothetical protein